MKLNIYFYLHSFRIEIAYFLFSFMVKLWNDFYIEYFNLSEQNELFSHVSDDFIWNNL